MSEQTVVRVAGARWADVLELTKPRISVFVTLSAMVGYVMASAEGSIVLSRLGIVLLGTFLTSGGAAALNQYMERVADGRMRRTSDRPLPSGRLGPAAAVWAGIGLTAAGLLLLVSAANVLTALFAGLTTVVYLIYTYLKPRTLFNTIVGAVSGAIPPVGGWAAVNGTVDAGAWILFGILFFWQFPHFLGIFWLYRDDYARGGFRVLPVEDADGSRTGRQMLLYSGLLVPVAVLPTVLGLAGTLYGGVALLLSLGMLGASARFDRLHSDGAARGVVRASLIYQPVLWAVLLVDKL